MGTGMGTGTETRAVVEMGRGMRMGTGKGTRTGSGRVEQGRRSARDRTIVIGTIKHFHSARVIISADRGCRFRAFDSSVRKARWLNTWIAPTS